jgi:peptidyl-prolyl cis-trans isomerase C
MTRLRRLTLVCFWVFLIAVVAPAARAEEPKDVIARVGDEAITLQQIDIMIDSSSLVGLDIPAPGTPERNKARLDILDKVISADLLHLDAQQKGLDKDAGYQHDVNLFSNSMLSAIYREKFLIGDVPVTKQEVKEYFDKNVKKGTEFTDDVRLAIESTLRREKFKNKAANMRKKLRAGVTVSVDEKVLNPGKDAVQQDSAVVATVGNDAIRWGEVKTFMPALSAPESLKQRREMIEQLIDEKIMAKKGLEAGLDHDPLYLARTTEYRKTRLVTMLRERLLKEYAPKDDEVRDYYKKNRDRIVQREVRKVQMVVVKSKKEAEELKKKIKSGKMTIFEAARDFSIDPNAKTNLGEIGWVTQETGFPALDKLTFSLKKDELGGPVESPVGFHLVKVLDVRDAMYTNIKDKNTWDTTRRMLMHEKMDLYTADLRQHKFPVKVYEDVFSRLVTQEAEKTKKKAGSGQASK